MGDHRSERLRLLLDWATLRIEQERVPNIYDNAVFSIANALAEERVREPNVDAAIDLLEQLVEVGREPIEGSRYVPLQQRLVDVGGVRSLSPIGYFLGQGVHSTPSWRGKNLYKSVWDMALYNELLWELQPGVILELGSGDGASADWLASTAKALSLDTQVVSFDAEPPPVLSESGPCFVRSRFPEDIDRVIAWTETIDRQRPWIVIEDMHVGLDVVLPEIAAVLRSGDYLIVEDSGHKQDLLSSLANGDVAFEVDQRYTDRFGINGTSAMNSIMRVA